MLCAALNTNLILVGLGTGENPSLTESLSTRPAELFTLGTLSVRGALYLELGLGSSSSESAEIMNNLQ